MTCPCRDCQCRRWSLHQKPRNQGNLKVIGFWWIVIIQIMWRLVKTRKWATMTPHLLEICCQVAPFSSFQEDFQILKNVDSKFNVWVTFVALVERPAKGSSLVWSDRKSWKISRFDVVAVQLLWLNSSFFEYIMWVGFSFSLGRLWGVCLIHPRRQYKIRKQLFVSFEIWTYPSNVWLRVLQRHWSHKVHQKILNRYWCKRSVHIHEKRNLKTILPRNPKHCTWN